MRMIVDLMCLLYVLLLSCMEAEGARHELRSFRRASWSINPFTGGKSSYSTLASHSLDDHFHRMESVGLSLNETDKFRVAYLLQQADIELELVMKDKNNEILTFQALAKKDKENELSSLQAYYLKKLAFLSQR